MAHFVLVLYRYLISAIDIGYIEMRNLSFQFKKGAEKYRTLKSKLHA